VRKTKVESLHKYERTIAKGVFITSLLVLIVLGSTLAAIVLLRSNPRVVPPARGWQLSPEIRIVMDSTADWARIMFNDLYGTDSNGIRIKDFRSRGWLLGNDSDDRIDAGRRLTFVDIIYNATVIKTGDIIGFFKGNNDFSHTRIYVDVVLEVNTDMPQVWVYLMLAGAGTTNFQFINKQSGKIVWQDIETGSSFTLYTKRSISPEAFFAQDRIEGTLVLALAAGAILTIVALNPLPLGRKRAADLADGEGEGL